MYAANLAAELRIHVSLVELPSL